MQRAPSATSYPITTVDLDFIEHVGEYIQPRDLISYRNHRPEYEIRSLLADLKSYLRHPDHANIGELCEFLPLLKNRDRITLLNMRPTLIKDIPELVVLLRRIKNEDDRLLLACSQIEKAFQQDLHTISRNIILLASTLSDSMQLNFCKFALQAMLNIHQLKHDDKQSESFTLSFLFSALTNANNFTNASPAITMIAFIGAIANTAREIKHLYQREKLGFELARSYSIWKNAATKKSAKPEPPLLHRLQ